MTKNTRRWCKGQVGREHTPVVRQVNWYVPSGWSGAGQQSEALHFVSCSTCGKKLPKLDWRNYPITEVVDKR